MNLKKIILINFAVLFSFIVVIEVIFGYWFKDNNFGIYLRSERNVKQIITYRHNKDKLKHAYKRNFYAFRGDEFSPSEVKIVFLGGSTGNQRFTPEKFTIVGILNKLFKQDNLNLKIFNASTDGKSTRGYVNDFLYWFPKIPNFNPKIFIFYIGINDSNFSSEWSRHYDYKFANNNILKIRDYIKNNSITFELINKFENKYFPKITDAYFKTDEKLYKNFNYINFHKAKIKFANIKQTDEERKMVKTFNERLKNLKIQIEKFNVKPIFITQIKYNGSADRPLFLINQELKKFCKSNNFNIIALDELIQNIKKEDFFDPVHTSIAGSNKIANTLYPELVKKLK